MAERFIPALGHAWLTRFYDPVLRWTMREATFKARLVAQADVRPGHRVLDLGCGTATLTILVKRSQPDAEVVGLDGDPEVLRRAAAKIAAAGVDIALSRGWSDRLPHEACCFDRVVTSLLLHHLSAEAKRRTLAEVHRVLRPGGQIHIADWGQAQDFVMRGAFLAIQLLDGFATTTDNIRGRLPAMLRDAGFAEVQETARLRTIFGTLSLYRGERPR
ncbi:class I SAM-dependent methyltransferase [Nannocystis sp. SCPEA4]|uniref:class I SAM-dependent methyltransferase n=1 Tax=Nannocystis sp. SCPEA4 TaxID=2996787 RepID=UPI00226E6A41|nr:class I SAM-dependent methyltransferase [Nannocystis sp. SCPEA4]MCY1057681.1 class I SAM-dependent methyltransferase [Nannocystis sp. SCPEA4]